MQKLTFRKVIDESQFTFVEEITNIKVPQFLKDFMGIYAGFSTEENRFNVTGASFFSVSQFIDYQMFYHFSQFIKDKNLGKKIPFALDDGGWVYCITLDTEDNYNVVLLKTEIEWENESDVFDFVCSSFEDFINGLKRG